MKAKLKKTGEIINIADYARVVLDKCDSYGNPIEVGLDEVSYLCDDDGLILGMPKFTPSKILEVNDITDWQQVRINAAIAAMQGLLSTEKFCDSPDSFITNNAIELADALIQRLKNNNSHGQNNV